MGSGRGRLIELWCLGGFEGSEGGLGPIEGPTFYAEEDTGFIFCSYCATLYRTENVDHDQTTRRVNLDGSAIAG